MLRQRLFTFLLLVLDAAAVLTVFNAVARLRHLPMGDEYLIAVLTFPLALLVLFLYLIDGYKPRTNMLRAVYASQHLIACATAMFATLVLTFVFITSSFPLQSSRMVILASFAAVAPLSLLYRRALQFRFAGTTHGLPLVFIGHTEAWLRFKNHCHAHRITSPLFFCDTGLLAKARAEGGENAEEKTQPVQLLAAVQSGSLKAEAIVLADDESPLPEAISTRMVKCYFGGTPGFTYELFAQVYWRKISLDRLNHAWLLREGFRMAREPVWLHCKRLLDIFGASLGLLLVSPLLALSAIAIFLEDGRPVLFRQRRIGKDNRPFTLLKLRTMRLMPPGQQNPYTEKNDPRVTRIGRFLRASRLDEFPQLVNVLRGEMSLIGPRAEWDRLVATYEKEIPCYSFRHLVKPGITGWAQVNYPYGSGVEDSRRKLEYDLYYIRHYSFLLDASIVLKTLHVMLFGEGR